MNGEVSRAIVQNFAGKTMLAFESFFLFTVSIELAKVMTLYGGIISTIEIGLSPPLSRK